MYFCTYIHICFCPKPIKQSNIHILKNDSTKTYAISHISATSLYYVFITSCWHKPQSIFAAYKKESKGEYLYHNWSLFKRNQFTLRLSLPGKFSLIFPVGYRKLFYAQWQASWFSVMQNQSEKCQSLKSAALSLLPVHLCYLLVILFFKQPLLLLL